MKKYVVTKHGDTYGILTINQICKLTKLDRESVVKLLAYGMPIRDFHCKLVEENENETEDKRND